MYALNLNDDGRILSACDKKYAPEYQPKVETLPEGDISDYLYKDGGYVYDPLPKPDEPTDDDDTSVLNALLGVIV